MNARALHVVPGASALDPPDALTHSGRMVLALSCDAAYAMPLATTLRSMVEANRAHWPVEVHVLVDGVPDALRQRVSDSLPAGSAAIRWVDADLSAYAAFPALVGSRATYARLLVPQILPAHYRRALYLDADILVLRDLGELWHADLQGASLGAVRDGMDASRRSGAPAFERVPRVRRYFNAGVLLMDLAKWRASGVADRALRYLQENPRSPYADQDALNVACDGDWKELGPKWNHQTLYHPGSLAERPAIVHFITGDKPWDASIPNPHARFYDQFRRRTLFARTGRERMRDAAAAGWAHTKTALKRIPFLRTTLHRIGSEGATHPAN